MAVKDAKAKTDQAPTNQSRSANPAQAMDKRLEPLEEFRDRAEGWMKEVTAQVARLAGNFEQEDKRREALENRIADIEERIRSLLTLTELISLDKNPFASKVENTPNNPAETPAPETVGEATPATGPSEEDAVVSDPFSADSVSEPAPQPPTHDDPQRSPQITGQPRVEKAEESEDTQSEEGAQEHPDRPGVEVIPVGPEPGQKLAADREVPPSEPEHKRPADKTAEESEQVPQEPTGPVQSKPTEAGPETEPGKISAHPSKGISSHPSDTEKTPTQKEGRGDAYHPNDAGAEPSFQDPAPGPSPVKQTSGGDSSDHAVAPDAKKARRMLVIRWADILAPVSWSVDVDAFTRFYVEAGWVDRETARLTERLVEEMVSHVEAQPECDSRQIHEATVELLAEYDPTVTAFTRVDDGAEEKNEPQKTEEAHSDAEKPNVR